MGTITRNFANSLSNQQGVNPTFKNLIINGDMSISQQGAKTGATSDVGGGAAGVDRFNLRIEGRTAYVASLTQTTDVPAGQGFRNSLEWKTTTAETSLGATGILRYGQRIEKQMLRTLNYGTASAEQLTLSFWIKSSVTGTFIGELWDREHTKYNSQTFTVSSADTWEKKSMTFAGNTSDAFDLTSVDNGMEVSIWIAAGTNFSSAGSPTGGAWSADATYRAGGVSNAVSTTLNATVEITGYQLEIGNVATDFEQIPTDIQLHRCKRYFQRISRPTHGGNTVLTGVNSQVNNLAMVNLPVEMRAAPSVSQTGTNITLYSPDGGSNASASNPTLSAGSFGTNGGRFLWGRTGNIYSGFWVDLDNDDSYYNFNAEI